MLTYFEYWTEELSSHFFLPTQCFSPKTQKVPGFANLNSLPVNTQQNLNAQRDNFFLFDKRGKKK